jgi:hypothetical protein
MSNSPNTIPAPTLGMWPPFLASTLARNAQAHEEFAMIAREWQDFLGRRVKEDIDLMQRLTKSGTPNQMLDAYTDFWHKAADDYGKEIATMSKLMTEAATKMATTMHAVTRVASETR